MTQLSPNFSLEELTRSEIASRKGWSNTPGPAEIENLRRVALLLQDVRRIFGKPLIVTSGFRSKQVNDAVGSSDKSQHRLGCAADFRIIGVTPREVVQSCIKANIAFDQIILEFDSWTHISVPTVPNAKPRGSKLIIDRLGARMFE